MPLLKSCLGCVSLRKGSFIIAIYTLILYIIVVMMSALHIEVVNHSPGLLAFTVVLICTSGCCVISSVLLIIGLCVESKTLLVPWLIAIAIATSLDIFFSISSVFEEETEIDSTFLGFFMIAVFTCLINIYSLLVVGSQFQIYRKDSQRRMENFSSILEKADRRSKNQFENQILENSNASYQLYNEYDPDHEDNHSMNPSHTSLVSSEALGLQSSCKRNCSESCDCLNFDDK